MACLALLASVAPVNECLATTVGHSIVRDIVVLLPVLQPKRVASQTRYAAMVS